MKKLLLAMAGVALTAGTAMADSVTFDFLNNDYGMTRYSGNVPDYNPDNTVISVEGCPVTITVNSGTRLWADGLRLYKQSELVFAGATITNIEFSLKSGADAVATRFSVEPEGLDGNIWTGSSDDVIFTSLESITKGNIAAETITITYEGGTVTPGKKNPEISWAETDVICDSYGMRVPHLDNPYNLPLTFSSSNQHVASIEATLDEDGTYSFELWFDEDNFSPQEFSKTVITATFEGNDEYEAASASYNLYVAKVMFSFNNIGWEYEDGDINDDTILFLFNTFTVAYKNGKNTYICDGFDRYANRILVYGNLDYNVGDQFSYCYFTYTVYNGIPEFKTFADFANGELVGTTEVEYPEVAMADIDTKWLSGVITIKNVEFPEGTPASKKSVNGKSGDAEMAFYNNFAAEELEAGTYDVVGAVTLYKDEIQIYPISYTLSAESGVEAVAADGEAQWFNLQGQRVANPEKGVCIRVQNGKAVKMIND